MLTINPNSLRLQSNGDGLVASGGQAANPYADPAGFASLLRQTQMAPPPPPLPPVAAAPTPAAPKAAEADAPADTPASPETTSAAPERSEDSADTDPAHRARALLKGKLQHADDDALPTRVATRAKADAAAAQTPAAADASDKATAPATTKPGDAAADPNLMPWLAALQRPAAAVADKLDTGSAKDVPSDPATAATTSTDARTALAAERAADAKVADALQGRAHLGLVADPASNGDFGCILTETRQAPSADSGVAAIDHTGDVAAAGAAAAASAHSTQATADVAPPAAVSVAAPVTSPDFAQELGMHLSVLAKDGVQQAELHLNPTDMGPVSVQITMDGTQAHVAFGADQAATRHAIEAGLPQLASALSDAGYTLAGGGVSQHAGGRSGGQGQASSDPGERRGRSASAESVGRVATTARRIVRQGGVDLFA